MVLFNISTYGYGRQILDVMVYAHGGGVLDDRLNGLKGSLTVEAVFIIPIVFYIVLIMLYVNFFLHDYHLCVSRVDHIIDSYDESRDKALINEEYVYNYLNEGLWFSKISNVTVSVNRLKLRVKADVALELPNTGIYGLFSILGLNNTYENETLLIDRTETARVLSVGIDTLGRMKVVNDIVNKFLKK